MKISLLKLWAMWRRFRRGAPDHDEHHLQIIVQIELLMRRANPFAGWSERANWMVDVSEWLRRRPRVSRLDDKAWNRISHQRTRFLLDWLDGHRDVRRTVQATLQKTLREAAGPDLFCATGLPREQAFFSELADRIYRLVLPRAQTQRDLSMLFAAMFPRAADAEWLLGLDQKSLSRIWKLCADGGITHNLQQQIDDALTYLASMVIAVGISPDFQHRLEPKMPLQATPFLALRRELEKYLMTPMHDETALRSVRMLIAVCQAQTDRIYAHLDEHGLSVSLVYRVERMRAQLTRMARLIDLRSAAPDAQGVTHVQALLRDLIDAHHHRSSVRGLITRSFSLRARKMVERNADRGEQYLARDRIEYRSALKAACVGGALSVFTVLLLPALTVAGMARFFEGVSASLVYAASFLVISALGGILAGSQSAVVVPALASRMEALDTEGGLRHLLGEITAMLRAQAAAVFGNLLAVIPTIAVIGFAIGSLTQTPLQPAEKALAAIKELSLFGPTALYAGFTGILLWASGLAAGYADNWFALHKMREALAHHRRLVHALGTVRARSWAAWLERHVARIAGNVSLAALLGMSPVLAQFFGLPLDIRHVTLSAGALTVAAGSLGWGVMASPEFWLAIGGVGLTGLLSVGVAFSCALTLALWARDVPVRKRRLVFRAVLRRLASSPHSFLVPEKKSAMVTVLPIQEQAPERIKRFRSGR
ncbi:MAG TPA: preprotein translocase subunit TatB [Noviherbaspirillum sp.]|nr:preprotein translocase subunit TatB [Noviherbaspirillum sp.]